MMTSEQYRQKASQALEVADAADDPQTKSAWEANARDWLQLARTSELQERLLRAAAHLGKAPSDDGGSGPAQ